MSRRVGWRSLFAGVLTAILWGFLLASPGLQARTEVTVESLATVALAELPKQGVQTYQQIQKGGPFEYEKDGTVFGNRERLLPAKTRGYYREYTVPTPGLSHRGKRRIVCGGPPRTPEHCYYTADHYASFRRIVP
jgi:ribonuclease T1